MGDRIEEFLSELDRAVTDRSRIASAQPLLEATLADSGQLAERLELLAAEGFQFDSLASDDMRALSDEIRALLGQGQLRSLIENASALLKLVEDGIVDGDAARLRRALDLAEQTSILAWDSSEHGSSKREVDPSLVRVRCADCGVRVVGRRRPAATWDELEGLIQDHESAAHDGAGSTSADSLVAQAQALFEGGVEAADLGHFSFSALGHENEASVDDSKAAAQRPPRVRQRTEGDATRPVKAYYDRAAQWRSLPVGTRFARRSDPSIVGEIVEGHGFLVEGRLYRFTGRGAPLSAAGRDISGTSENGWVTWVVVSGD